MTKYSLTIIICALQFALFASNFEGKITFQRIASNDTTYFTYFVKDNHVRVDEHTKSEQLINSMLVNLDDSSLMAISPLRKMYMPLPVQPFYGYKQNDFSIKKTKETINILAYNCQKWEVRNDSLHTRIEYFVARDAFHFFLPFLIITNRSEKSAGFFLQIQDNEGYFPFKSVEYNLDDGQVKLILKVTQIKKMKLDDSLFEIPADYMLFEH